MGQCASGCGDRTTRGGELVELEQEYDITNRGYTLKNVRPLFKRLREAEAVAIESLERSKRWSNRCAQLERVVEAAKLASGCTDPNVVEIRRDNGTFDRYEYRSCGKCLSCGVAV